MPLTTPLLFTDATEVLVLLQVPPVPVVVRVMVAPVQTVEGPDMVPDVPAGLTVSGAVANAEPQLVVEV